MVIQNADKTYEVLRQLWDGKCVSHCLCRVLGDETEQLWDVAMLMVEDVEQALSLLPEWEQNQDFTDFAEYFLEEGRICLVFGWRRGESLTEVMKQGPSSQERWEIGRQILEKILIQSLPVCLQWEVLKPESLSVGEDREAFFFYGMEEMGRYQDLTMKDVWERLAEVFRTLFREQLDTGLYPELEGFLGGLEQKESMMDAYQEYLPLLPCIGEDRAAAAEPKETLFQKIKKRGKKILLAVKLALGTLALLGVCLALVVAWKKAVYPVIQSTYLVRTMYLDSEEIEGYTGRVSLLDPDTGLEVRRGRLEEGKLNGYTICRYDTGRLEYEGMMAAGTYCGQGKLYNQEGTLIYEGNFLDGLYDGSGILYDYHGNRRYRGTFVQGEKEGNGSLYEADGELLYEGGFVKGNYDGNGTLYEGGMPAYEGGFSQGKRSGEGICYEEGKVVEQGVYEKGELVTGMGTLYDEAGQVVYEGGLERGRRSGEGIAYENGQMIYQGGFALDRYEGDGKLYSPNTGGLIYEGGFSRGEYKGEGILYDPGSGCLLYQGGFRLGRYDGEGSEYDGNGNLAYEGEFRLGSRSGKGVLYDPFTGEELAKGAFRDGVLTAPEAEEENPDDGEAAGESEAQEEAGSDGAAESGAPGEEESKSEETAPSETAAEAAAEEMGPGAASGTGGGREETDEAKTAETGPGIPRPEQEPEGGDAG